MIWFIIWIMGCFVNCYLLNKYDKDNNDNEIINYLRFDYRINIIFDVLKCLFIFSSFIGTIFYIIMKLRDKHNENI